jgi:hypothetical protein
MIRRDHEGGWLIIAQIDHARLAGALARAWGNAGMPSVPALPRLSWGIEHHDDGWAIWDASPRINPASGRPRDFREMRMRDSTAIWSRSIEVCSAAPLAGISVSRHFCHLAEQARRSPRDSDELAAIDRFLREQSGVQADLAAGFHWSGSLDDFSLLCNLGFYAVQFFDRLSLWLCCAAEEQPCCIRPPAGEPVTFHPRRVDQIVADPYPFEVESIALDTSGRRIAAREYESDDDFAQTYHAAPLERLTWTIVHPAPRQGAESPP